MPAASDDSLEPRLFELPEPQERILVKRPERPIWTENKAVLIQQYLRLFLFITKHGTYIDGFAGPQDEFRPESWAANLVLDLEPKWMRHFYLFDLEAGQVERLEALKARNPDRDISVTKGDFNKTVHKILRPELIREKEATFCLLDQRSFECEWSTLRNLAQFKTEALKIELFYFLAEGWFNRAVAASGPAGIEQLRRWWGRDDFLELRSLSGLDRALLFCDRFTDELRYRSVKPWPIYERNAAQGRTMYFMIHATDHPDAPELMSRAYRLAVVQPAEGKQLSLDLL